MGYARDVAVVVVVVVGWCTIFKWANAISGTREFDSAAMRLRTDGENGGDQM